MEQYYYQRPRSRKRRRHPRIIIVAIILILAFGVLTLFRSIFSGDALADTASALNLTNVISSERDIGSVEAANIPVDIIAANACVMNAGTGGTLYQKGADEQIAPASTAKLLTALTVLDYLSPDATITVGSEIEAMAADSSRAWLYVGDTLTVRQLLIALLLPSGNDAAYTLAENACDDFVGAMNRKAAQVGATSSNFVSPDGYDAEGQYTTAYDLAQIAKACLENDCLAEIMGAYSSYERWQNGREVTYYNTNELLNPESAYYYPEAIGLKTGNSSQAGACLASAAVINGETYICIVMGSTVEGRFQDAIAIFDEIKESL